jgi:ribosomal protein S18 acetylase RimI-like enzyme
MLAGCGCEQEYKQGGSVAAALLQQEGSPYAPDDLIVGVYFLGVDFEYRRQGIGTKLLDFVRSLATSEQIRYIALAVSLGPFWGGNCDHDEVASVTMLRRQL